MKGIKHKKSVLKKVILEKTNGLCACCGRKLPIQKVTIEHTIPKYRGGQDDIRNLLPLCKNCNKQKGSTLIPSNEYYPYLKKEYMLEVCEYKEKWQKSNQRIS